MASALPYQISHGTVGIPLAFNTATGPRCGHYVAVRTPTGKQGYAFRRDPNAICGLPTKGGRNAALCTANPQACANIPLPNGYQEVGQTKIMGSGKSETMGGRAIV